MAAGAVGGAGGPGGSADGSLPGFWEPPRFDEAVCCMPGMDCWTGEFANAAGRAGLLEKLAMANEELVFAKETYDILNAENEREASLARAAALADATALANKLVNQIADS